MRVSPSAENTNLVKAQVMTTPPKENSDVK